MNNIFDLKGKVAVVTGGYGYLGTEMSKTLSDYGAVVYVAGRTKSKFVAKFGDVANSTIRFAEIDIMKLESVNSCFEDINAEHGKIDILINNAQASKGSSQENMSDEDFIYTLDGVLGSTHRCIKAVLPYMKSEGGKIINIGSMYGLVSPNFDVYKGHDCEKYTNPPHYGTAKAGVKQLTKYFAVLFSKYNIQVNSIAPGPFPSENVQKDNPKFIDKLRTRNPMSKIGTPKDLSGSVLLLSSSGSNFMTGQTLQVDGGWTIW